MSLQSYIDTVKSENPKWKSNSRIIGRAGELYCCYNLKCVTCKSLDWLECKTNEKSKDQICKNCSKKYQIKCKSVNEKQYTDILKNKKIKCLGGEYNTTLKSIEENIDYIFLLYDKKYKILDVISIEHTNVKEENIIARKPLSQTAKRAGWQGCYLHFNL